MERTNGMNEWNVRLLSNVHPIAHGVNLILSKYTLKFRRFIILVENTPEFQNIYQTWNTLCTKKKLSGNQVLCYLNGFFRCFITVLSIAMANTKACDRSRHGISV